MRSWRSTIENETQGVADVIGVVEDFCVFDEAAGQITVAKAVRDAYILCWLFSPRSTKCEGQGFARLRLLYGGIISSTRPPPTTKAVVSFKVFVFLPYWDRDSKKGAGIGRSQILPTSQLENLTGATNISANNTNKKERCIWSRRLIEPLSCKILTLHEW